MFDKVRGKVSQRIASGGLGRFLLFALRKIPLLLAVGFVRAVIWLSRPFVFIRIGSLHADKIGPLLSLPGLYLFEKDHGVQPADTLDIFHDGYGDHQHICNQQLLRMWKRVFVGRKGVRLMNSRIVKGFFDFARKYSLAGEHIIGTTKDGRDILGLIEQSKKYLEFTEEESARAEAAMRQMGIEERGQYVCILNRDQSYLRQTFPGRNWGYQSFRNCNIQNYIPAAEQLAAQGYHVIRMGAVVGERMNTDNPMIIDYAARGFRSELLDIYLPAHCAFFVGCNSGLDAVSWFFHRPEVYVNISDLEYIHSWLSNSVMIFKKYWLKTERRFMTVTEMIRSGAGRFNFTEQYEKRGIELIENTPEEICDAIAEMRQRLSGTWQEEGEDEELQHAFWSNFQTSELHGVIRARIGAKFLRQNKIALGVWPQGKSIIGKEILL